MDLVRVVVQDKEIYENFIGLKILFQVWKHLGYEGTVLDLMTKVSIRRVAVISKNVPLVNLLETLGYIIFVKEIHKIGNVTVNVKADSVYSVSLRRQVCVIRIASIVSLNNTVVEIAV